MNNEITPSDTQVTDLCREDDLDQFRDDCPIRCEYSGLLIMMIYLFLIANNRL